MLLIPPRVLALPAAAAAAAAGLLLTGCGAQAPDWTALANTQIEDVCGQTFRGDEVVRLAYDGAPYEALPVDPGLPDDALLAGRTLPGTRQRIYPCASDADSVVPVLEDAGFTNLRFLESREDYFLVEGDDPFDIPGTFVVLDCAFATTLEQTVGGDTFRSSGIFGDVPAYEGTDLAPLLRFAAVLFQANVLVVRDIGFNPIVEPPIVALGMDEALEDRVFCEGCEPEASLRTCATWVEPNFTGGCDRVRVGQTFTVLRTAQEGEEETGPVWQPPLIRTNDRLTGWCNRSEF